MVINVPTDPLAPPPSTPEPAPTPVNGAARPEPSLDGGFPIEGDGGTVDSAGQVHVPPPPPS